MRVLKFRGWYKGAMYEMAKIGLFSYDHDIIKMPEIRIHVHHEDVELMQYTGVKDKNGKEIYEGDILKDESSNHWYTLYLVCFGEYDNGEHNSPDDLDQGNGWYLKRLSLNGPDGEIEIQDGEARGASAMEYYEVAGNIHENPDLIPRKTPPDLSSSPPSKP